MQVKQLTLEVMDWVPMEQLVRPLAELPVELALEQVPEQVPEQAREQAREQGP